MDQNEVKSFCDVLESHLEKETKERCYSFIKKKQGILLKVKKEQKLKTDIPLTWRCIKLLVKSSS